MNGGRDICLEIDIEVKIIPTLKVKVNHSQKTIGTLTKVFFTSVVQIW